MGESLPTILTSNMFSRILLLSLMVIQGQAIKCLECDNEDSDPKKRCDAAEKVVVECPTGGKEQWRGIKDINGVLVKKWCEAWHDDAKTERTECHCIADSCNTKVSKHDHGGSSGSAGTTVSVVMVSAAMVIATLV